MIADYFSISTGSWLTPAGREHSREVAFSDGEMLWSDEERLAGCLSDAMDALVACYQQRFQADREGDQMVHG